MTISTTRGTELDVDTIVRRALQLSGILPASAGAAGGGADFELGRAFLGTIIDALQADGVYARSVLVTNISLTKGDESYSLATSAMDVVGDGKYVDALASDVDKFDGETIVKQIDRETYERISSKAATSRPTQMWINRQPTLVEIKLWPIPDEAGTLRVQVHQWLADVSSGENTTELKKFWDSYLIFEVAAWIAEAKSVPGSKIGRLQSKARQAKGAARAQANQHSNTRMILVAPTGWRSR